MDEGGCEVDGDHGIMMTTMVASVFVMLRAWVVILIATSMILTMSMIALLMMT